ncbi:MAG: polymerase sigma-54 factor [Betaproteobacteria bacterium]|nr:polymerase sigma-54 factor [Betaproteobacteria bacterium]
MKQALQLKLSQHLTLTPQLQQSIRLLQLSTIELNQEIEQILAENPLLERDDDAGAYAPEGFTEGGEATADAFGAGEKVQTESLADAFGTPENGESPPDWTEREFTSSSKSNRNDDDDEGPSRQLPAAESTLRDHLMNQVATMRVSALDRGLITALIEALNEDGYLGQALEEILEMLPEELEIELEDLEVALRLLQSCDPPGVAARNLSEALVLQLHILPPSRCRDLAVEICRKHLELLAARDFAQLKRACRCDDDDLREAHEMLLAQNPRPGAQYAVIDTRYITPDVIARKIKGQWKVGVNPAAVPKLRINRLYAEILSRERGRSTPAVNGEATIHTRFQEAKWLLKNVHQRFETIERVAQAIVERQKHFFDHGEVAMRPLVLREIADELGLHESTISRVTTNKYMLTPRGIFELKYFFGSHVATDSGGACSSTAIRALIKQLVTSEDVKKPLSDSKIADILGQQGIVVARRTIAKYRDGLKIPPANLRKSL